MRILIVDDDGINRMLLNGFLNEYGRCYFAKDGEEAIDTVRSMFNAGLSFDLIFLDIMMPKMDGLNALKLIRQMEKEFKYTQLSNIIMCTALDNMKYITDAYGKTCDGYLPKPIGKQEVMTILKSLKLIN